MLSPTPTASYPYTIGGTAGFGYNGDPATGQILPGSPVSGDSPRVAFRYDHTTQLYTLVALDLATKQDRFVLFKTPKDAINPTYTDNRFLGYSGPAFGGSGILRLYRPASTNPELKLTYSSFGNLARTGPSGHLNSGNFWFAYGVETKGADIATNGTAAYSGVVHGFAVDPVAGKQFRLEGITSITLDYGLRKASGSMSLTLISADGTRISIGAANFSDRSFSSAPGATEPTVFGATLIGPQAPELYLEGTLYGPGAGEISGKLSGIIAAGPAYGQLTMVGAFAAAK